MSTFKITILIDYLTNGILTLKVSIRLEHRHVRTVEIFYVDRVSCRELVEKIIKMSWVC